MDMTGLTHMLTMEGMKAFFTVVMIDLVLAGDNAVVIGLAAAGLPKAQRGKAIFIGVIAATVLRIAFALAATQLLAIVGLLFFGGLLLLWVCWKMWRELHDPAHDDPEAIEGKDLDGDGKIAGKPIVKKTLGQAVIQIVIADVSMSLDNVLAVAGAAHDQPVIMAFGLALSVLLMGVAATLIARLLHRFRWIAYIGLAIILWVALHMMWVGGWNIHDCNPAWFGQTQLGPNCPFAPGGAAAVH
jgi:YjbE family integral membrane protein